MMRPRKKPRGFYARLARARSVSMNAVHRPLNPETRPCAREKQECDASPPWDPCELISMDGSFCEAMQREIARGTERPRCFAAPPAPRAIRPARPAPRHAGSFTAERSTHVRERDRSC
jgi:hypothetical protein